MPKIDGQITLQDIAGESYQAFVDKFKPKKTTDDCYTPPLIYDAVLAWVVKEYGIDAGKVLRPFFPGGDYESSEYPPGSVVVDNPPFSIIGKICRDYTAAGIPFFLFAPYLTCLNICPETVCHIITGSRIEYENGAIIDTAFVTNLDDAAARTSKELYDMIDAAAKQTRAEKQTRVQPKYSYPAEVVTAAQMGYIAKHGEELRLERKDVRFVRKLDAQAARGKQIFGGGYLLSEKAAAEKAAAEKAAAIVWELSDRERQIVRALGGNGDA